MINYVVFEGTAEDIDVEKADDLCYSTFNTLGEALQFCNTEAQVPYSLWKKINNTYKRIVIGTSNA